MRRSGLGLAFTTLCESVRALRESFDRTRGRSACLSTPLGSLGKVFPRFLVKNIPDVMSAVHPRRAVRTADTKVSLSRAGMKPRDTRRRGDRTPPSANKVFGYRLWLGAILFLEYALIRKAVQFLKVKEAGSVALEVSKNNLMAHPWLSIAINVLTDAVVLWYLNAFPGVPECGITRAPDKTRTLKVKEWVPILGRHVIKMVTRIQPVSSTLLGAKHVHHGYTLKQTMLMIVSPTFFNVAFGGSDLFFLAAMSALNVGATLFIAYFNWFAYEAFPNVIRPGFFQQLGTGSSFYSIGVPMVGAAPFVFAFLTQNAAVQVGCDVFWRVNSRLYFGSARAEQNVVPNPGMITQLAKRLRTVTGGIIPCVVAMNVLNVIQVVGASLEENENVPGVVLVVGLACLAFLASVVVPYRVVQKFFTTQKDWRAFNENARNASQVAAFRVALPYAACTALACAVVTRSSVFEISKEAVTSLALNTWLPTWVVLAACVCAMVPHPDPARAALSASLSVAVAVGGVMAIDPSAARGPISVDETAKRLVPYALFPAYFVALHVSTLWSTCSKLLGEQPAGEGWIEPQDGSAGAANHWRVEDFEIDPARFEVRELARPLRERHAQMEFVPLAHEEPRTQTARNTAQDSARDNAQLAAMRTDVWVRQCRAAFCQSPVCSDNALAAGLTLCAKHLLSDEPFQCTLRGGAAHFCVQCRRVHAPPRCDEGGEKETRGGVLYPPAHAEETAHRRGRSPRVTTRSTSFTARKSNDVSLRAWYKTDEGPVEATKRMRDVISYFANAKPGGARVLHAEACVRPGCTLLTVDIGARFDDDAVSSTGASRSFEGEENPDDEEIDSARRTWRTEDVTRAFQDAGVRGGLDGVFDFEAVDPGSGETSLGGEGKVDSRRRLVFHRHARRSDLIPHPRNGNHLFSQFEKFQTFGAFGGETEEPDPVFGSRTKMPILRSDRFDFLTLPTAPPGYEYVLRCGGSYIPLMASRADSTRLGSSIRNWQTGQVAPTNAEGLGFVELVSVSTDAQDADTAPHNVSPLFSATVFLTSDRDLAHELDHEVTGARSEHAPMLFNIGAALTGRACGAVLGNGEADSQKVKQESVFHAACACASMGWSVALGRVIEILDATRISDEDDAVEVDTRRGQPFSSTYGSSMSEAPDTATDDFSSDASETHLHRAHEKSFPPVQTRKPGSAMLPLLRAACSSGDALTARLVTSWVICNYGAVAAGDLLVAGDARSIGGDWTPLHAAAAAVARRARDPCAIADCPIRRNLVTLWWVVFGGSPSPSAKASARAAVEMLVISADPLSWVSGKQTSPSFVLRRGEACERETVSSLDGYPDNHQIVDSLRKQNELAVLDGIVLRSLAGATQAAVAFLRLVSKGGNVQTGFWKRTGQPRKTPFGFYQHFAAAASLASFHYDGSHTSTMAVALLSPGSAHAWDALRLRALDDTRGAVTLEEATTWLNQGAPAGRFPDPTPTDVITDNYGPGSVLCLHFLDAAVCAVLTGVGLARVHGFARADAGDAYTTASIANVFVHFLTPIVCGVVRAASHRGAVLRSGWRVTLTGNAGTRLLCGVVQLVVSLLEAVAGGALFGHDTRAWTTSAGAFLRMLRVAAEAALAPANDGARETLLVITGFASTVPLVHSVPEIIQNVVNRNSGFQETCVLGVCAAGGCAWLARKSAPLVAQTACGRDVKTNTKTKNAKIV